MSWLKIAGGKSGAREVAVALLIFWAFLVCYQWFWIPKEDMSFYKESFGTISIFISPIVLGAFGIAAVMNRLNTQPPPASPRGVFPPSRRPSDDPD